MLLLIIEVAAVVLLRYVSRCQWNSNVHTSTKFPLIFFFADSSSKQTLYKILKLFCSTRCMRQQKSCVSSMSGCVCGTDLTTEVNKLIHIKTLDGNVCTFRRECAQRNDFKGKQVKMKYATNLLRIHTELTNIKTITLTCAH